MNKIFQVSLLLGVAALTLSGCGFRPMYGGYSAAADQSAQSATALSTIAIDVIPDREGQVLRNDLMDRFYETGAPVSPTARLHIDKVNITKTELDLTKSSEATRAQLHVKIHMALTDPSNGQTLLLRDLQTVTSYNILESEFATRVTEDSALQSALHDIARQVELNLSLYYNNHQK